ncbi:helix-turn-helix domain-containing protein [Ktedonobacter sp. SOSP1-52]|uniref:winged helix-turn-helix transcriptional regulator n=1 Tax=Ktedonobacter sp. SOSP1-52 TaxID=2778366 RepID=UPI001F329026|nr:helix-turn-helix domain-containing protein [Ktedonobacter sp. SOSP1-52]
MLEKTCPVERALEILEGKWTILVVHELLSGVKRFGELRRSLHPISPKTLTDRLRMLEEQGIVRRTMYSEVPLHIEYQLTERGQRLQLIFDAMKAWGLSEDLASPTVVDAHHAQRQ